MSKHLLTVATAILVLSIAGAAEAWSAKWCFKWRGVYHDADPDFGDDVFTSSGANDIEARYSYVRINKWNPSTSNWDPIWNGYLDSAGCSDNVDVFAATTYRFRQFLLMQRGSRVIEVHPDGVGWDGYTEEYVSTFTTSNPLIYFPSYPAPVPPDSTNNRLMPAMTQVLANANTLDLPDGVNIDVTTDPALGCGSWCSHMSGSHYHVCISDGWSRHKYNIAHELGHVVSKENDGPRHGEYCGSEGFFNPGAVCDCSSTGGYTHCPTSREFTGSGQKEGFSHFVAAAAYNTRSHVDGALVFYKDMREANVDHYFDFPDIFEFPNDLSDPEPAITPEPFPTPLDTSSFVKWTEYECDPAGEDFEHYGNEWDWLAFFWNLYANGGTNKFEVSQINAVWDSIAESDRADLCCLAIPDPANPDEWIPQGCDPRDTTAACNTPTNPYPIEITIGKLWEADDDFDVSEGARNQAYQTYFSSDPDKYYHFRDSGIDARINY